MLGQDDACVCVPVSVAVSLPKEGPSTAARSHLEFAFTPC